MNTPLYLLTLAALMLVGVAQARKQIPLHHAHQRLGAPAPLTPAEPSLALQAEEYYKSHCSVTKDIYNNSQLSCNCTNSPPPFDSLYITFTWPATYAGTDPDCPIKDAHDPAANVWTIDGFYASYSRVLVHYEADGSCCDRATGQPAVFDYSQLAPISQDLRTHWTLNSNSTLEYIWNDKYASSNGPCLSYFTSTLETGGALSYFQTSLDLYRKLGVADWLSAIKGAGLELGRDRPFTIGKLMKVLEGPTGGGVVHVDFLSQNFISDFIQTVTDQPSQTDAPAPLPIYTIFVCLTPDSLEPANCTATFSREGTKWYKPHPDQLVYLPRFGIDLPVKVRGLSDY